MQAIALLMGESIRDAAENKLTAVLLIMVIVRGEQKLEIFLINASIPLGLKGDELVSTALYTQWDWSNFSATP